MDADGFVLVHGSYHGAWCWDEVRPLLRRPSIAVDLPGRGARPARGEPVTVAQCVDAVLADADAAGFSRFVLVGHSMGGITITETANRCPERVARLVYVAALVLPVGSTVFDLYFGDGPPPVDDPAGFVPLLDQTTAWGMFASDLTEEAFAEVHARCVPEPVGLYAGTVSGYDSGVPTTFVRCSRDGTFNGPVADEMIERLHPDELHEVAADHDIMVSNPRLIADLLNDAIGA